jgi:hypothetical protein
MCGRTKKKGSDQPESGNADRLACVSARHPRTIHDHLPTGNTAPQIRGHGTRTFTRARAHAPYLEAIGRITARAVAARRRAGADERIGGGGDGAQR